MLGFHVCNVPAHLHAAARFTPEARTCSALPPSRKSRRPQRTEAPQPRLSCSLGKLAYRRCQLSIFASLLCDCGTETSCGLLVGVRLITLHVAAFAEGKMQETGDVAPASDDT